MIQVAKSKNLSIDGKWYENLFLPVNSKIAKTVKLAWHEMYPRDVSAIATRPKIPMLTNPRMLTKHSRIAIKLIKFEVFSFLMM